ncbi:unnamed protein product [Sphagnum jensenii]|uniref:Germin-like protein n=1 Tax=Sphagnum jensenii TaxID=128206 RepID=A0ABP0W5S4_9BRYO
MTYSIRSGVGSRQAWQPIVAFVCTALMAGAVMVQAADPDPLQDFCVADLSPSGPRVNGLPCKDRANVTSKDFLFTDFRTSGNVSAKGTNAYPSFATVFEYPALNTLGISHVRLDFGIGGVVPPHTHPFSSETLFVVQGSIYTGFVSFDGVLYAETLQKGDIYIYPKGTLHFQINVGTGPAITFNSLNSQYPGFLVAANQLLLSNIPAAVLESSLGISNATDLNLLEASVPPNW